ncbi:MAG: hypothetical protein E4G96_03320 [Chrysiogenales bacterium]|nr:MAG: hypothetical protein E4G96_03320 [Chrysiogenales bacterium]
MATRNHLTFLLIVLLTIFISASPLLSQNPEKTAGKETKPRPVKLTWVDMAYINYYPVPKTRFADFSKVNFGGSVGLNLMIAEVRPLWVFINLMADGNISNTHRMKRLIDAGASLGLGWRFHLKRDKFFLTPRISYGFMHHAAYGRYYSDPQIYLISRDTYRNRHHLFSDQYMQYDLEFAYDVSPSSGNVGCEVFLAPSFIHFIERHRQGLEIGYRLGVRINVEGKGAPAAVEEKKNLQPTILAGKIIDADTGRALPRVAPTISGGRAVKADPAVGENFSFTVDAGKQYTLRAEYEGYEPLYHEVDRTSLVKNKKTMLALPMKPAKVWGIFGHVFEKDTDRSMGNVDVIVTENGSEKIIEMSTDGKGDFRMELKPGTDYNVLLRKRRYFTVRGTFTTRGRMPGWFDVKKFMRTDFQKVEVGATVDFGNIYYDSGSWAIRPDVTPELEKIVMFLSDNPTIVVELGAHTDSMGDAGQNMALSQKRAQSAVDYLIRRGVATGRITAKGYGETRIMNRCVDGIACSAVEHQANRRTELKVLKITR